MQTQQSSQQTSPERKKKTGKRWPKILFRVLLYLITVLCIVIIGAFLSLQTRPVRDAITQTITKAVAQNTRAVCHIEELSGNLLSRFEIKGIKLTDAKTKAPLVTAGRIDVSYSIPMLLGRVLWINRLTIDGVSVNLLQVADGTWNFKIGRSARTSTGDFAYQSRRATTGVSRSGRVQS